MNAPRAFQHDSARVFVAIRVPGDVRQQVLKLLDELRARVPRQGVRWTQPRNMHLTLRFIGNVPVGDLDAVKDAVRASAKGIGPFRLRPAEPGCFPHDRDPRVLWVGLHGDLGALHRLQQAVSDRTASWGPNEERDFHPHLTLGRVVTRRREDLARIAAGLSGVRTGIDAGWQVEAVELIQSVLSPGGSEYSTLASARLTG